MTDTPAPRSDSSTSPTLAVSGLLALVTVFLASNPESGVLSRRWPWETFRTAGDLLLQTTFVLWLALAIFTLALAFVDARKARCTVLLALTAPVLTTAAGVGGAFPLTTFHLSDILLFILMGAGLWLQATDNAGVGRTMAAIAGALFLWSLAVSTDADVGTNRLVVLSDELMALLRGERVRPNVPYYAVWTLIPRVLITMAALVSVVLLLWRNRWVARVAWTCLASGLAFPIATFLGTTTRSGTEVFTRALYEGFTNHGLVMWLIGTFVVADALRNGRSE